MKQIKRIFLEGESTTLIYFKGRETQMQQLLGLTQFWVTIQRDSKTKPFAKEFLKKYNQEKKK